MALSQDAEQILVLAQQLTPNDKLELAERLISEARHDFSTSDNEVVANLEIKNGDFTFDTLPMVGIWSDREDMADPVKWVQETR